MRGAEKTLRAPTHTRTHNATGVRANIMQPTEDPWSTFPSVHKNELPLSTSAYTLPLSPIHLSGKYLPLLASHVTCKTVLAEKSPACDAEARLSGSCNRDQYLYLL